MGSPAAASRPATQPAAPDTAPTCPAGVRLRVNCQVTSVCSGRLRTVLAAPSALEGGHCAVRTSRASPPAWCIDACRLVHEEQRVPAMTRTPVYQLEGAGTIQRGHGYRVGAKRGDCRQDDDGKRPFQTHRSADLPLRWRRGPGCGAARADTPHRPRRCGGPVTRGLSLMRGERCIRQRYQAPGMRVARHLSADLPEPVRELVRQAPGNHGQSPRRFRVSPDVIGRLKSSNGGRRGSRSVSSRRRDALNGPRPDRWGPDIR